jgi:PAS domain S-box-containing protein
MSARLNGDCRIGIAMSAAGGRDEHDMERCVRTFAWGETSLGPMESWPPSLRQIVDVVLSALHPSFAAIGPELRVVYNDAYVEILQHRHPDALGQPMSEVWAPVFEEYRSLVEQVMRGEATYFVDERVALGNSPEQPWRWFTFSWTPWRDETGAVLALYGVATETTARVLAETELRARDARQAYLLRLEDAIRPLADAVEIQEVAARVIAEEIGADRVYYTDIDLPNARDIVRREYRRRPEARSVAGTHAFATFPTFAAAILNGRTFVVDDVQGSPLLRESEKKVLGLFDIAAVLQIPFVKGGVLTAQFIVTSDRPRPWQPTEIALAVETAERTWAAVARARAEVALRESEERFRTLVEAIDHVFYVTELEDDRLIYLSPAFERVWGRPRAFLLEHRARFFDTVHPDDRDRLLAGLAVQRAGEPTYHEYRIVRPDGTVRWIADRSFPMPGETRRAAGLAVDVTDAKEQALRLEQEVQRSETLMREVEHRVKNGLATVNSLLSLQANGTADPAVREALEDAASRVLAVARYHQQLYSVEDLTHVRLDACLRDIAAGVEGQMGQPDRIALDADLAPIVVGGTVALPVSLIVNELLTNAYKYAFPYNRKGSVALTLVEDEGWIRVTVADDGIGRPAAEDTRSGLGTRIVDGLARQLHGRVETSDGPGYAVTLAFPSARARR